MQNLLENLVSAMEAFRRDAELQLLNNNKAAGGRARKMSLAIEKALKDFRKKSLDYSK